MLSIFLLILLMFYLQCFKLVAILNNYSLIYFQWYPPQVFVYPLHADVILQGFFPTKAAAKFIDSKILFSSIHFTFLYA